LSTILVGSTLLFATSCDNPANSQPPAGGSPTKDTVELDNGVKYDVELGTLDQYANFKAAWNSLTFNATKGDPKDTIKNIKIVDGSSVTLSGNVLSIGKSANSEGITTELKKILKAYLLVRLDNPGDFDTIEVWGTDVKDIQDLLYIWNDFKNADVAMSVFTSKINRINMINGSSYSKSGTTLNLGISLSRDDIADVLGKIARGELVFDNSRETVHIVDAKVSVTLA